MMPLNFPARLLQSGQRRRKWSQRHAARADFDGQRDGDSLNGSHDQESDEQAENCADPFGQIERLK